MNCTPAPCTALLEGAVANRAYGTYGTTDNESLIRELSLSRGCDPALMEWVLASKEVAAGDALEAVGEDLDGKIPKFLGPR